MCVSVECPHTRKLSFSQEPDIEPCVNFASAAIMLNSELLVHPISDGNAEPNANGDLDKAELTCISEEGIADMDLPDNLFDDFDYIGDCITSCNKVYSFFGFINTRNIDIGDIKSPGQFQVFIKENNFFFALCTVRIKTNYRCLILGGKLFDAQ